MAIKLDERKIFTRSTTPSALNNCFVTQMLTRDLFAVANLVKLKYRFQLFFDIFTLHFVVLKCIDRSVFCIFYKVFEIRNWYFSI